MQYAPSSKYTPAPTGTIAFCRIPPWPALNAPMRLRQTVFLDVKGQERVMQGFMILDPTREQARLVGMSEFGMKLFDLTITRQDHVTHAMSPILGRMEHILAGLIAQSVRRVFLPFCTACEPEVHVGPDSTLIINRMDGVTVVHECEPQSALLVRTFSPNQGWEIDYADYRATGEQYLPERITYQDHQAGFRLVFLLHEVFFQ